MYCKFNVLFRNSQCLTRLYLNGHYSIWCQKIVYEDTELERIVVSRIWLYYMIKIVDLLDTVNFHFLIFLFILFRTFSSYFHERENRDRSVFYRRDTNEQLYFFIVSSRLVYDRVYRKKYVACR